MYIMNEASASLVLAGEITLCFFASVGFSVVCLCVFNALSGFLEKRRAEKANKDNKGCNDNKKREE